MVKVPGIGAEVGQFGRFHLHLAYLPILVPPSLRNTFFLILQTPIESFFVGEISIDSSQVSGILFALQHSQMQFRTRIERLHHQQQQLDNPREVESLIAEGKIITEDFDPNHAQRIIGEEIIAATQRYHEVEQGIHELESTYHVTAHDAIVGRYSCRIPPSLVEVARAQYTLPSNLSKLFYIGSAIKHYGEFHLHELQWKQGNGVLKPTVYYAILLKTPHDGVIEVGIIGIGESDRPGFHQRLRLCLIAFQERIDTLRRFIERASHKKNLKAQSLVLETLRSQQHEIQVAYERLV